MRCRSACGTYRHPTADAASDVHPHTAAADAHAGAADARTAHTDTGAT